jgi:hypothetical protein
MSRDQVLLVNHFGFLDWERVQMWKILGKPSQRASPRVFVVKQCVVEVK